MTRINSAIRVELLTDEHLLAEHREIKRIPSVYVRHTSTPIPKKFTLGKGHVLFFIDKAAFTAGRYELIREECIKRGFSVENYFNNWKVYDSSNKDYMSTLEEYDLLIERISDRLMNSKKPYWHYYGNQISKEQAVTLLKT